MNIYTQAFESRKPKKNEIRDLLVELYESTENDTIRARLAEAYRYFTPTVAAKPKTRWDWVSLAISNDQTRPHLHNVWCDGEYAVAIDGHRLHMTPCNFAPGYYTVDGKRMDGLEDQWTFPDYKRVIPDNTHAPLVIDTARVEKKGEIYHYKITDNFGINKRYHDQSVGLCAPTGVAWDGDVGPVRFDFADGSVAVVMGIRL